MTNPENVSFSKYDPVTGTVVEFKGDGGAKGAYDADMDTKSGHDKPIWAGKRLVNGDDVAALSVEI